MTKLYLLFIVGVVSSKCSNTTNTLELVHVVFRHGNRTPDRSYPTDPYSSESYYPVGYGELTLAGKKNAYNVGVSLRRRYIKFLGEVYTPEILEATSTEYSRSKASTLLLLAGLFPPKQKIQKWNMEIKWQPIPYSYVPESLDKLLRPEESCSKFKTFVKKYMKSSAYISAYALFRDVAKYITKQTGVKMELGQSTLEMYSILKAEQEWGLKLPSWTKTVWPETLSYMTAVSWREYFGSEELRKLGAGFLMSKIVNDTNLAISGKSKKGRKIYLYGGHDTNIVAILIWLGVFEPHIPRYSSYIIFEIHKLSFRRFIRIFYQNYNTTKPVPIQIPNCGILCAFGKFVRLYSKYLNPVHLCD